MVALVVDLDQGVIFAVLVIADDVAVGTQRQVVALVVDGQHVTSVPEGVPMIAVEHRLKIMDVFS